ncbi:MAG: hypothetical protein J1F05_07445 [Muribaculaceae bacterium]|nr:hypothetical protein [Muribaculaceae bacterium]
MALYQSYRRNKYKIPFNILTPVNPIVNKYIHTIPEKYRNNPGLMDFLVRLAPKIYESGEIGAGVNPFYKIIEILGADKLYYSNLQKIKEYYNVDIIRYLTQDNLVEYYVDYPCYCAADLKNALGERRNITDSNTLVSILSGIV